MANEKRRRIDMTGQENFTISATNPNAGMGLPGCACGSWRCPGPFIVFPQRINQGTRRGAFVSVSLACAKKAVVSYERGDVEVANVGNSLPGEDGQPAVITPIEESDNPYFQTGVATGESAVPIGRLLEHINDRQDEIEQAERAAGITRDDQPAEGEKA